MAEVVLDANILVAHLDANDSLHPAAVDLVGRLGASKDHVLHSASWISWQTGPSIHFANRGLRKLK